MSSSHDVVEQLDISERLRWLMTEHKLTVVELASHAGVSKSAMEKYLSGPSSPRATAIASICMSLNVNAEWLLFGRPDTDLRLVQDAASSVIIALLNDLRVDAELQQGFQIHATSSQEWRMFTWELADLRAIEVVSLLISKRQKQLEFTKAGLEEVEIGPYPLYGYGSKGEVDPNAD